jgi:hypothetical protein
VLPISKEFKTEILTLSDKKYEEYLKYTLPVDTGLTKEWGETELNLTFTMLDTDDDGNIIQRVRKTDNHILKVVQIPEWDAFIPDPSLSAIDQRILKQDAQIKALAELADAFGDGEVTGMVDNLVYDETDDTLQLSSNGVGVGDKVSIKDMLDDGSPAVDFDSNSGGNSGSGDDSTTDDETNDRNFVEF